MHFMVFTESFTAEAMCRFLDRLAGHFDHKVHPDDVELHLLPSYSPELTPDELVDADLKHSLPGQHRARDQAELAAETRRFFRRRQRQPHIVRSCFGGPTVRYVLDENPTGFQDPDHTRTSRPQLVTIEAVAARAAGQLLEALRDAVMRLDIRTGSSSGFTSRTSASPPDTCPGVAQASMMTGMMRGLRRWVRNAQFATARARSCSS